MYSRRILSYKNVLYQRKQTRIPRVSKEKKNSRKAVLLIDLRRDGPVVRWVCIEKGRGEKVCVEAVASNSSVSYFYQDCYT